ncbi:MAG: T9SS type A sorting domain-containing protein [Flavobacteriales bacterium]
MKLLVTILAVFSAQFLFAQQSVLAAGADGTGAGGSISYSIGQIDYLSVDLANGSIYQGVQQPYELFVSGVSEWSDVEVNIFPNPTNGKFFISLDQVQGIKSFKVFDLSGQLIKGGTVNAPLQSVDISSFSSGIYFIQIISADTVLKTVKVIKN